jgi:hypothetical protein
LARVNEELFQIGTRNYVRGPQANPSPNNVVIRGQEPPQEAPFVRNPNQPLRVGVVEQGKRLGKALPPEVAPTPRVFSPEELRKVGGEVKQITDKMISDMAKARADGAKTQAELAKIEEDIRLEEGRIAVAIDQLAGSDPTDREILALTSKEPATAEELREMQRNIEKRKLDIQEDLTQKSALAKLNADKEEKERQARGIDEREQAARGNAVEELNKLRRKDAELVGQFARDQAARAQIAARKLSEASAQIEEREEKLISESDKSAGAHPPRITGQPGEFPAPDRPGIRRAEEFSRMRNGLLIPRGGSVTIAGAGTIEGLVNTAVAEALVTAGSGIGDVGEVVGAIEQGENWHRDRRSESIVDYLEGVDRRDQQAADYREGRVYAPQAQEAPASAQRSQRDREVQGIVDRAGAARLDSTQIRYLLGQSGYGLSFSNGEPVSAAIDQAVNTDLVDASREEAAAAATDPGQIENRREFVPSEEEAARERTAKNGGRLDRNVRETEQLPETQTNEPKEKDKPVGPLGWFKRAVSWITASPTAEEAEAIEQATEAWKKGIADQKARERQAEIDNTNKIAEEQRTREAELIRKGEEMEELREAAKRAKQMLEQKKLEELEAATKAAKDQKEENEKKLLGGKTDDKKDPEKLPEAVVKPKEGEKKSTGPKKTDVPSLISTPKVDTPKDDKGTATDVIIDPESTMPSDDPADDTAGTAPNANAPQANPDGREQRQDNGEGFDKDVRPGDPFVPPKRTTFLPAPQPPAVVPQAQTKRPTSPSLTVSNPQATVTIPTRSQEAPPTDLVDVIKTDPNGEQFQPANIETVRELLGLIENAGEADLFKGEEWDVYGSLANQIANGQITQGVADTIIQGLADRVGDITETGVGEKTGERPQISTGLTENRNAVADAFGRSTT